MGDAKDGMPARRSPIRRQNPADQTSLGVPRGPRMARVGRRHAPRGMDCRVPRLAVGIPAVDLFRFTRQEWTDPFPVRDASHHASRTFFYSG